MWAWWRGISAGDQLVWGRSALVAADNPVPGPVPALRNVRIIAHSPLFRGGRVHPWSPPPPDRFHGLKSVSGQEEV